MLLSSHLWEAANILRGSAVERVVSDIDAIVRHVRFDRWQKTHAGEREIKKALRKTLFKYQLHSDTDLFERAYEYIREYYAIDRYEGLVDPN